MSRARKRHSLASQVDSFGLVLDNPRSIAAEAYRTLRTNIQFYNVGEPMRRLLVTSAGPSEGKSTTAANLAITFAQAEQRVIVVDADLRRPYLHRVFQLSNLVGLTNVMLGSTELQAALLPTAMPGLSVLPTGPIPPNPAEMLGAPRMGELLDKLNQQADMVIIDTPPILAVTDAAVLSPLVDGVILVAAAGQVNREMAQRAKSQLDAVKARVLGVVLNGIEDEASGYYSYYYYGKRD